MTEPDHLAVVRGAVHDGEWQHALDELSKNPAARSAEGLELRAQAAYGAGDFDGCISAWEELHALHLGDGERALAARAAAMLAMFLLIDTALMAPVRGWLRTAERALEGLDPSPSHALIPLVRTYERFISGDMVAVRVQAKLAIELGERFDVLPAVMIGRMANARVTLLDGKVAEGLQQLDEIAMRLMAGDVDPMTTGMLYCELICAAQGLGLHDRAVEWTELMERWRTGAAFGGLHGRCRVHRAEMLRVSGTCERAEEQALLACEELKPWMRREYGWPLVELGNVRLRKGDLEGAEVAFLAAHERAWSAQPGLALLRLEQGDVGAARAMIDDALAHPFDLPWKERPPSGELRFAPLLAAQAEIAEAGGDIAGTQAAADALARIAERYASPSLQAAAQLAEARARLLAGDLVAAKTAASGALTAWAEIGAPFDAAVARTVLARAREREGQSEAARMEWQAARNAFAAFGASAAAARCDEVLRGPSQVRAVPAPAARAEAVFRRVGGVRTVSLGGVTAAVPDLKGLRYVERMLAAPDREFHALDLVAVEQGIAADQGAARQEGLQVLDDRAREAYRRRLAEVQDDIDDATAMNDPTRRELAERDRDYLIAELRSAVGLGGRARTTGGSAERARTAVTRSIRYALDRLGEHHPVAATHLGQRISTGTYCSYSADPLAPVDWVTSR
jgi:hypothetical protein